METVQIPCQFTECTFVAKHDLETVAVAMFNSHLLTHQPQSSSRSTTKQKLPPIARPNVKQDITEEEWTAFELEWNRFKRCTDIPHGQEADQLYDCCEKGLGRLLVREDPAIVEAGEKALLDAIKRMAVIKVATSVRRTKLLSSKQDHGETFREFYANVKAQASVCKFAIKCPHQCCKDASEVDYTPMVIKDILISGIADNEIRKDVLEWPELDSKSDKDIVGFVEGKETAKSAWSGSQPTGVAGLSSYKKAPNQEDGDLKQKLSLKSKCLKCKVPISLYVRYRTGRTNKTPFKLCYKCHKESNPAGSDEVHLEDHMKGASKDSESAAISSFVGAIDVYPEPHTPKSEIDVVASIKDKFCNGVSLDHHIFTADGWKKATSFSHPTLRLRMTTNDDDYAELGVSSPRIAPKHIDVIADSGAQSCLWSRREFLRSGFKMDDLIDVHHSMEAANNAPIQIDGAIILRLSGQNESGLEVEAAVMTYISPDAKRFYLSRQAMIQLQVIHPNFPCVGSALEADSECNSISHGSLPIPGCGCLKRELPPGKPETLPFACSKENSDQMKEWLFERYASSTFNKCPHQILPEMEGPPIKFHIDPDAKPVIFRKPAPVPLHWQEQVEQDLLRDVSLGVLERVPHGEPTTWCFRMVVTRKDDGGPRRTVDLSPLNKFCQREAHASKSPYHLARSIPPNSIKTVCDAWNGYHSVPLREEDRHLTTFTTPWGLFRYKRAPQGFLSSGDGYNRRFDDIAAHVMRMERCVDDSLLHDSDLEAHWWRVIEFLELVGNNGIVLNPEKFQFSQDAVEFAGFRISATSVEPLPKYIDAIRNFPTPTNIRDIRSWFGLVNQVSHYAQLRDMMEPFRKFLSPKTRFEWNDDLNGIFEQSKNCIIEAIREGVKIFDITRPTCLRTDWAKSGIGYFLAQKHCSCESRLHGCCEDGWKITLAGSRFLSQTEANYAPVEGEALAVVWSLDQTRFFTMGCNDLLVITDHKPLLKIFGDRRLDEIDNPRLFRLKRRTLMWKFNISYMPGRNNAFSDATSRHPNKYAEIASLSMRTEEDIEEDAIIAGVIDDVNKFFAVTWERVRSESLKDQEIGQLIDLIQHGFPNEKSKIPNVIREYWGFRDELSVFDGVVLYKDRIVIPSSLRSRVLENLHSAHQGTCGMSLRAQDAVFWPGITCDVSATRDNCRTCHRNAPSQAKLPPSDVKIPQLPFQMIYADYFQLNGKYFLVVGDRLSGWPEIVSIRPGTTNSGSKGLCEALRRIFVTFGVPEELSSDGGPEFTSREVEDFLFRWGTKHRLSSAYFPQSNGRAEVAVKAAKRLLEGNMGTDGYLNTDNVVRALLQQRNTPDRDCKLSPAEVLFGHKLRDTIPQLDKSKMVFENPQVHNQWHSAWSAKEEALRSRLVRTCEKLEKGSKELEPLREGDAVFIQNQDGSKPLKWDREGTVIHTGQHDQYLVRVHGTGRLTLRNRRFLRKFQARKPFITEPMVHIEPSANPEPKSSQDVEVESPKQRNVASDFATDPQRRDTAILPSNTSSEAMFPREKPARRVETTYPGSPDNQSPFSVDRSIPETNVVTPEANAPPSMTRMLSPNTSKLPPAASTPFIPRRSERKKNQRMVYDPATGKYVEPTT